MKYRHELKYFISESDICVLQQQLRPFMVTDQTRGNMATRFLQSILIHHITAF